MTFGSSDTEPPPASPASAGGVDGDAALGSEVLPSACWDKLGRELSEMLFVIAC